jgi:hypothetical protein
MRSLSSPTTDRKPLIPRFCLAAPGLVRPSKAYQTFQLFQAMREDGWNPPRSLAEAQKSPLWSWWLRAMQVEKEQLEILKTWELVSPPQNARILPGKWVFKLKLDADGAPLRLKARWVARGFQQQEGLDYHGQV